MHIARSAIQHWQGVSEMKVLTIDEEMISEKMDKIEQKEIYDYKTMKIYTAKEYHDIKVFSMILGGIAVILGYVLGSMI